MIDRGMIKWQPFSAVISGDHMITEVLKKKNKITMPILSDDQKYEIQEKILAFYNTQENIKVKYYRDGRIYIVEGKINSINKIDHNITINSTLKICFSQIIEIY